MSLDNLEDFTISPELFSLLPAKEAARLQVFPLRLEDDILHVATSDIDDLDLEKKLKIITGMEISLIQTLLPVIQEVLKNSESSVRILEDISESFKKTHPQKNEAKKEDENSAPVVKLLNSIIAASIHKNASDIHIQAEENSIAIRYRIDGVLQPATENLDRKYHQNLISRLKVLASLDITENKTPQDGRFEVRVSGRILDFRISILPSLFGENVVIRLLNRSSGGEQSILSLEDLGFASDIAFELKKCAKKPSGMVLVTGATGNGKSTTLYSILNGLNSEETKIITIEDPVEYQLKNATQIAVNEAKGLTFAKGLRSILRHDPDVIMVGEIRDAETAEIATQSALTGHSVFSTLHANTTTEAINRMKNIGADVESLVASLNAILAQKLVRKLCPNCKIKEGDFYDSVGCKKCNETGYKGRTVVAEFLHLSPKIKEMILEGNSLLKIREEAIADGMLTLRDSAMTVAKSGISSLAEINRVTSEDEK